MCTKWTRTSSRLSLSGLVVLSFTGCVIDAPASSESLQASDGTSHTIPTTSGSFVGSYVVPTSADLASAAIFSVPEVDWTISSGTVTLHYDLPVGLVGGVLDVTLSGPITAGDDTLALSGTDGTGTCTAAGTVITCHEQFTGLGTLPISMLVVQQTAQADYAGPVGDRTTVASIFGSDPIGIVDFDLTQLAPDDHGGGGDSP